MKHGLVIAFALLLCAAAQAADPPKPAASRPVAAKPLDLRIGDIRKYMTPKEYLVAINAPDADKTDIVVEGARQAPKLRSELPVPGGLGSLWYAATNPLPALDTQMNGGGAFRAQTQRGPTAFTGFRGYPQPQLLAFSPRDPNLMVAAGNDSGVFVSTDGGASWTLVTDPFSPAVSGKPHIPRPQFAHFDHLRDGTGPEGAPLSNVDIYVGTRGRGVFRIRVGYVPTASAGGRPSGASPSSTRS